MLLTGFFFPIHTLFTFYIVSLFPNDIILYQIIPFLQSGWEGGRRGSVRKYVLRIESEGSIKVNGRIIRRLSPLFASYFSLRRIAREKNHMRMTQKKAIRTRQRLKAQAKHKNRATINQQLLCTCQNNNKARFFVAKNTSRFCLKKRI